MRRPSGDRLYVDVSDTVSTDAPSYWVARGHEFLRAAEQLDVRSSVPKLVLLGYAVELGLKGFLLAKGAATASDCRKHGHDTSKLLRMAEAAGLPADILLSGEAETLDTLFDAKPGENGRFRAGIYPIAGPYGYSFGSEFVAAIRELLDTCKAACPRPSPADLARFREQLMKETAHLRPTRKRPTK
jgi:hypothetical protein